MFYRLVLNISMPCHFIDLWPEMPILSKPRKCSAEVCSICIFLNELCKLNISKRVSYACQGVRNFSFFGKFGVLCFLVTTVLRFVFLLYCRRNNLRNIRTLPKNKVWCWKDLRVLRCFCRYLSSFWKLAGQTTLYQRCFDIQFTCENCQAGFYLIWASFGVKYVKIVLCFLKFYLGYNDCSKMCSITEACSFTVVLSLILITGVEYLPFCYNHGHNILRFFDAWPNFCFTTSEMKRDY